MDFASDQVEPIEMTREIKFRAWVTHTNESFMLSWEILKLIPNIFNREDFLLMQITGLKDKNGKEIYEGDLIRWVADNIHPQITKDPFPWIVSYQVDTARWAYTRSPCSIRPDLTQEVALEYEVIGNIHETPELLK